MSAFSRDFLRDRVEGSAHPRGFLALFGKHPGWDDHVEDLPLATQTLVLAKQNLYVQGVGGQVSSGNWARLADGECLPVFDHTILWRRGSQFLAGRLWASTDGKRRAHFPMVALVHCINVPLGTSLGSILSWLETVEAACKATRSADRVRSIFEQCQRDFQGWIERSGDTLAEPAEPVDWGIAPEALTSVLAEIQTRGRDFTPARYKERSQLPATHFRVPITGRDRAHDLRLWTRLLGRALHEDAPRLFAVPRNQSWLDIIVGEPATQDLFSLRASQLALPVIADAQTTASSGHARAEAETLVSSSLSSSGEVLTDTAAPSGRGWLSRLLGGRGEGV